MEMACTLQSNKPSGADFADQSRSSSSLRTRMTETVPSQRMKNGIRENHKSHEQRKGRKNGTANNVIIGVKIIPNRASGLRCRNSITATRRAAWVRQRHGDRRRISSRASPLRAAQTASKFIVQAREPKHFASNAYSNGIQRRVMK
jgi:hypothetical protein